MNSWFFPGGILLAITSGLLFPDPGIRLYDIGLIPWLVACIFLVYGFNLELQPGQLNQRFYISLAAGIGISLLLAPLLGLAFSSWFQLPLFFAIGLIVNCAMPPTLTSGIVITGVAQGNVLWALMFTIIINVIGVLTIPSILVILLPAMGDVVLSPWPLFGKLLLLVLLPFVVGQILFRYLIINRNHPVLAYLPSVCIMTTIWLSVSSSQQDLFSIQWSDLMLITIACVLIHTILLGFAWLCGGSLGLRIDEKKALMFVTSQKTLPAAISILTLLPVPIGLTLIPCILFHFLQLFIDSVLATRLRLRQQEPVRE